jgi:hypothetical protein
MIIILLFIWTYLILGIIIFHIKHLLNTHPKIENPIQTLFIIVAWPLIILLDILRR